MYRVVAEGFSPDFGLFTTTPENTLYPRPDASVIHEDAIRYYEFVGRVLGKCVYELVLVDVSLAQFFVSKILNHRNHGSSYT
jgi:ubiquitin-protein ligase E3 C